MYACTYEAQFHSLGIEPDDAWTLFKLMDSDKSSLVEWDEFVKGCMQLSGMASAIDLAQMNNDHRWVMRKLDKILKVLDGDPLSERPPSSARGKLTIPSTSDLMGACH